MTFTQAMALVNTTRTTVARGFTVNAYHDDRRMFDVTYTDGSPGMITTDQMDNWTTPVVPPSVPPNPVPNKTT